MNFSKSQFFSSSQRCQQWPPFVSHQFRLRHLSQIIAMNLSVPEKCELYFTLHATIMSAPFYTSERVSSNNPKWLELSHNSFPNSSALAVVVRIWKHVPTTDMDCILLTWGVNFSGLVYIGNKMMKIMPACFTANAVIFNLNSGYFTSNDVIKTASFESLNVIKDRHMYMKLSSNGLIQSYSVEKLRRLHNLQLSIKKKTSDVQGIRDKIEGKYGSKKSFEEHQSTNVKIPTIPSTIRYEPQPLTMNSLHKLLHDKPTKLERQKIRQRQKDVEVSRFRNRLLIQEIDRKLIFLRQLRKKHTTMLEDREEKHSDIMDSYYTLSKDSNKLRAFKETVFQYRTMLAHNNSQLLHRRKQLLKQLILIYPITCESEKYYIHGIHFPNSDMLADSPDTGLSVALGYVAHILTMCGVFLQVPLRYPVIHYGSRSSIIDNISPFVSDKDREFPLYSRGKEKIQYIYAVYLLNKNLAQLRWLFFMHTSDLRATLANLLDFLSNDKNYVQESVAILHGKLSDKPEENKLRIIEQTRTNPNCNFYKWKLPSLPGYQLSSEHPDPILDSVKAGNMWERSTSLSNNTLTTRNDYSNSGLDHGEILSVPEHFLTEQRSSDVFKNFMEPISQKADRQFLVHVGRDKVEPVRMSTGHAVVTCDDRIATSKQADISATDSVKYATDILEDSILSVSCCDVRSSCHILEHVAERQKHKKHVSRSEGSYTDDDSSSTSKLIHEAGSAPVLGTPAISRESSLLSELKNLQDDQEEFLKSWLKNESAFVHTEENVYTDEANSSNNLHSVYDNTCQESPLMARTDALLKTKSFNLVKPKY